tara:strand:+ start:952 stop:1206 length:255 start_codon:yes stop_codon:yes gene_type:complete
MTTINFQLEKHGSQWFVWQSVDDYPMHVHTKKKTKADAMKAIERSSDHWLDKGHDIATTIYDGKGNFQTHSVTTRCTWNDKENE